MIPNDILQRIDDETDILKLASEYITLEKRGKNYLGLCPFHDEKTPSFSVSPEKNIAKCMGCGQGGRPINFYRQIKNISLEEAATDLADRLGIDVSSYKTKTEESHDLKYYKIMEDAKIFYRENLWNSKSGEKVLEYLKKRKLTEETIREFDIGYSPKERDLLYLYLKSKNHDISDMMNLGLVKQKEDGSYYDLFIGRLMFPISDKYGKVIAFSARTLDKNDNIKYINSPETVIFKKGDIVYNIKNASLEIKKQGKVILTEGFFDVIAPFQIGVKNVIATMGTALTKNQIGLIRSFSKNVVIAYDGDNAGIKATISAINLLRKEKVNIEVLSLKDKLDPDEYIKKYGGDSFIKMINESLVDSYHFEYLHYKKDIDLNNANDITTFLQNVTKMLENASPAVISLYKEKLATELRIEKSDIKIRPKEIYDQNPEIPVKQREKLPTKYEQAERRLVILMSRSITWHERINMEISDNEYAVLELLNIRKKMRKAYEEDINLDVTLFRMMLLEEELDYFDNVVCNDVFWKNSIEFSENEINEYLELLKETSKLRRIEYLKSQMINSTLDAMNRHTEEYRKLKKELDKNKGDKNGYR